MFTDILKYQEEDRMLTNECERDIQLELNRNYLKSFPARLKFCHVVSVKLLMALNLVKYESKIEDCIDISNIVHLKLFRSTVPGLCKIGITTILYRLIYFGNIYTNLHWVNIGTMFAYIPCIIDNQLEDKWKNSNGTD